MLLFDGEDPFQHSESCRIMPTQVLDRVTIAVDCDPLRHQVLPDHVNKRVSRDVLGMAATCKTRRREIWLATQLNDAFRNLIGMTLLFVGMGQEFSGDALRMDATGHEVVAPVAQDTD